jgi:endoglucanase
MNKSHKIIVLFLCGILTGILATTSLYAGPGNTTTFIRIDQFGYFCSSKKVAVIANPQIGFDSNVHFTPSTGANQYQVRNWITDAVVFSGTTVPWNAGATHTQSGDKVWWFDFTAFNTPGSYYIYDLGNAVGTGRFEIGDNVYNQVLTQATRMFFYQRCNFAKTAPYAGSKWADGAAYEAPGQDHSARPVWDRTNASLAKDMSGGWFDAGDQNKYVTFTYSTLIDLLEAYRENPRIFTDNTNIPESGNGIPDILDEVKWELDWLIKMQDSTDGSAYIKLGCIDYNDASPYSADKRPRYYVNKCSSASRVIAAVFALAATVYKSGTPSMVAYSNRLLSKAKLSWNYFTNTYTTLDLNCDDQTVKSGKADMDANAQNGVQLTAAMYLWEAEGAPATSIYKSYFETNYLNTAPYYDAGWTGPAWTPYTASGGTAMLRYTQLTNKNTSVSNNIVNNFMNTDYAKNQYRLDPFNAQTDAYRSFIPDADYNWGHNRTRSDVGNINFNVYRLNLDIPNNTKYIEIAEEHIHAVHGKNALNKVMLTNMYAFGAENSANEIYHTWFANGTKWSDALTSTNGPAPGYLQGGPNHSFSVASLTPPSGQPHMKSYKDWNASWNGTFNENSYEITEPAIYYQAAYIHLLSRVMGRVGGCIPTGIDNLNTINQENSFRLFPNPAMDELQINSEQIIKEVAIYTVSGVLVLEKSDVSIANMNIKELVPGFYIVKVKTTKGGFSGNFVKL